MAPRKTRKTKEPRVAGFGFSADPAGPCKQGSLVLFSGPFVGRGEGLSYWRERLGWVGEKPLRPVYNRFEAVGNPIHLAQSPGVRFVWVVTRGEWVEKAAVRDAGRRRENMRARPREDVGPVKAAPVKKKGPGRPRVKGNKGGAVGGGDAGHPGGDAAAQLSAPPPPPSAPLPAKGGKKRKAEETPEDVEAPTGKTTNGRPKRACRQPLRYQN